MAACRNWISSPVAKSCVYGLCAFVLRCFSCSHTVLPKEHSLGLMLCCIFLPLSTCISLLIVPCMIVYVTNNKEPWTLKCLTGTFKSAFALPLIQQLSYVGKKQLHKQSFHTTKYYINSYDHINTGMKVYTTQIAEKFKFYLIDNNTKKISLHWPVYMYFVNMNKLYFWWLQHIPKNLWQRQNKSKKVIEYPR